MSLLTSLGVSQSPTADQDLEQAMFLRAVTDQARVLTGSQAAGLCLADTSSNRIRMAASSGELADPARDQASAKSGRCGEALKATGFEMCASCPAARCQFPPSAWHQHLAEPVTARNRVRGALCVTSGALTLRRDSVLTLVHLAGLVSSCLSGERIHRLAARLGALTERQRIAADLHDGFAQSLTALRLQLDCALSELPDRTDPWSRITRAREAVMDTSDELRAMIESLCIPRDPVEAHSGLIGVLRTAARDAGSTVTAVSVTVGQEVLVSLPVAAEVRHIVMEALTNADRHANASTVDVRLRRDGRQAIVSVADNGNGFALHRFTRTGPLCGVVDPARDATVTPARGAHFGIEMMRLRAAVIGGQLEIRSAPGGGTEVVLRWPELPT